MRNVQNLYMSATIADRRAAVQANETVKSEINSHDLSSLIGTGSSQSYINEKTARQLKLEIEPSICDISMGMTNMKGQIIVRCVVSAVVENVTYSRVAFLQSCVVTCYV